MNEKDRVLELIKKGIISTEEGLVLLEKLDKKDEVEEVAPVSDSVAHLIPELNPQVQETVEETTDEPLEHVSFTEESEEETDFADEEEKTGPSEFDKEQLKEALNQAGEALKDASKQIKPYAANIGQILADAFGTVKTTLNDNVDWKNINVKVPKLASTKFSTEFEYPANAATIIDIQSTNGAIKLVNGADDKVVVKVDAKIYGAISTTPEEAFAERSEFNVTDEKIDIKILNKFVRADLVVELPQRLYDLVTIKSLNGKLEIDSIEAGDIYASSTNGDINMHPAKASMLEVKGVNGNVAVVDAQVIDTLINTVNGEVVVTAASNAISATLVNGNMRMTLTNDTLTKLNLSNVNGNIKVALPKMSGLEGSAKTTMGKINHRFANVEVLNATKKGMELHREADHTVTFDIRTTTGSVFLKDAE